MVNIILAMGTQLLKVDLKDTYIIVPVHPADQYLLGITWQEACYVIDAFLLDLGQRQNFFDCSRRFGMGISVFRHH